MHMGTDAEYTFPIHVKDKEDILWNVASDWITELNKNLDRYLKFPRHFDKTYRTYAQALQAILQARPSENESDEDYQIRINNAAIPKILEIQRNIKLKKWFGKPSFLYTLCEVAMIQKRYNTYINTYIKNKEKELDEKYRQIICSMEEEKKTLKTQLSANQNNHTAQLKEIEKHYEEKIQAENKTVSDTKQKEITLLQKECVDLQAKINCLIEKQTQLQKTHEEELAQTKQKYDDEVAILNERLRTTQSLLDKANKEEVIQNLKNELSSSQLETKTLTDENSSLKAVLDDKNEKLASSEIIQKALRQKLGILELEVRDLNDNVKSSNEKIAKLKKVINTVKNWIHTVFGEKPFEGATITFMSRPTFTHIKSGQYNRGPQQKELMQKIARAGESHPSPSDSSKTQEQSASPEKNSLTEKKTEAPPQTKQPTSFTQIKKNEVAMLSKQIINLRKINYASEEEAKNPNFIKGIERAAKEIAIEKQTGISNNNVEDTVHELLLKSENFFSALGKKLTQ